MNLSPRRQGDVTILPLQGRIDHLNAQAFAQALQPFVAACRSGGAPLLLDLSGLEYISSAGLRVFMLAAKQTAPAGGRLALAAPQAVVREILEISRFHLVFPLYATLEQALTELGTTPAAKG